MFCKVKKYTANVSKHNSKHEKQVTLLKIQNREGWHYIAAKKLSASLREISSNHYTDFYSLSCLHSFRTKSKPESHKKVCENKEFCNAF